MRVKDAAFGVAGAVLAVAWAAAAIRVWPAILPSAASTPTPRPSGDTSAERMAGTVAVVGGGDVFVIKDGRMRRVASGGRHDAALSPDGTRVAYTVDGTIDGKRTVDGATVPAHLAYSSVAVSGLGAGGEQILVNGLQRRDPNGFHVVEFESQPAWSPDGTQLAFISDGGAGADLQVYTLATKRVTTLSDGSILADPAWSPDGKTIAVTTYTQGTADVLLVPADGRTQARTLKLQRDGDPYRPSYSPDGRWLTTTLRSDRGNDVVVVEVSTGRVVDITADGASWGGVFSPTGDAIAYLHEAAGAIDLYTADVAETLRSGAAPKGTLQVTHDGALDGTSRPSWSR